ncbi:MAG: DUF3572 domain-containing protein [Jhaorihella sp.]
MSFSPEAAETLALRALGWLIGDSDLRAVFLGTTGASATDLRDLADKPEFLGSVLDFLLMDDAWIMRFCDECGAAYDAPMQARMALPGGARVEWT